jgi:predicted DNA-binding transcriptional regulator AlpA
VTADQLTTDQVAALAGISPASVRRYRLRGAIPEPDGYLGRTPWWRQETIAAWLAERSKPGRPRKRP